MASHQWLLHLRNQACPLQYSNLTFCWQAAWQLFVRLAMGGLQLATQAPPVEAAGTGTCSASFLGSGLRRKTAQKVKPCYIQLCATVGTMSWRKTLKTPSPTCPAIPLSARLVPSWSQKSRQSRKARNSAEPLERTFVVLRQGRLIMGQAICYMHLTKSV